MSVLPPRPLRVSSVFVVRKLWLMTIFTLLLLGEAALVVVLLGGEVRELWQHGRIWESGRPAESASMHGKVTSHNFVLHSYKLTVEFVDAEHQPHTGQLEFSTLFRKLDREVPTEVHYDPADPAHRFAVNTVDERSGSRWAVLVAAAALAGLVGFALLVGVRNAARWLRAVRRAAASSTEVALRITSVADHVDKRGRRTGSKTYTYERGPGSTGTETYQAGQVPLFTDETKQFLVALVAPEAPHWPIVLRSDRYPFA